MNHIIKKIIIDDLSDIKYKEKNNRFIRNRKNASFFIKRKITYY